MTPPTYASNHTMAVPAGSRAPGFAIAFALGASLTLGCSSGSPKPAFVAGPPSLPGCFAGPFAREVDGLLPPMSPKVLVRLGPVQSGNLGLSKEIEPGCTPPFRDDPKDDSVLDAGRIEGWTLARSGGKRTLVGRGSMKVARGQLELELHDDAAETTLSLSVRGHHVRVGGKQFAPFEDDIDPSEASPLALPLDALVQALARCDDDQRLLRSEDGNVIKARRADHTLWRTRWVDLNGTALVDTSSMCDDEDARIVWRSAMGDAGPLIAAASVRSPLVFTLSRQRAAMTDPHSPDSLIR
jgi:hypothetical protein